MMTSDKIVTLENARKIIAGWRVKGQKIVFTNGCFDIVHAGHIHLLESAKSLGDRLVVGINSDASIRRLKGPDRPIQDEHTRTVVMAALLVVDLVIVFEEDTPLAMIETLLPDVLIKGGDWKENEIVGADVVTSHGGKIAIIPLESGYSTTLAVEKILRQCKSKK